MSFWRRIFYACARRYWRWTKPAVLGARALVIEDGRALLVRLTYAGGWHLPGGGVARGEGFQEAAARELAEECGLRARDWRLFGLYVGRALGKTDLVAIYLAEGLEAIVGAKPDPEIAEMKFFALDRPPADATPATKRRLEEFRAGGADGGSQAHRW